MALVIRDTSTAFNRHNLVLQSYPTEMHFGTPYQSTLRSQQVLQNELLLHWTISAPARSADLRSRYPLDQGTAPRSLQGCNFF